jgi:hypothetical protein
MLSPKLILLTTARQEHCTEFSEGQEIDLLLNQDFHYFFEDPVGFVVVKGD